MASSAEYNVSRRPRNFSNVPQATLDKCGLTPCIDQDGQFYPPACKIKIEMAENSPRFAKKVFDAAKNSLGVSGVTCDGKSFGKLCHGEED